MSRSQHTQMQKTEVAHRILRRAAAMWGIEDPANLDPLVKLLVDVIAFEVATIRQNMVHHQGHMLESIASLLLPKAWLKPKPAHAIVALQPLEPISQLRPDHQFYLPIREKSILGEERVIDRFFTPLSPISLTKGQVQWQVVGNTLYQYPHEPGFAKTRHALTAAIAYDCMWLGLKLDDAIVELEELSLYIDFPDHIGDQLSLLDQVEWIDSSGQYWEMFPLESEANAANSFDGTSFAAAPPHLGILDEIRAMYQFRTFRLCPKKGKVSIAKSTMAPPLQSAVGNIDPALLESDAFWINATFPASFPPAMLHSVDISLNCVPMVNRKLIQHQTRLHRAGTIAPLSIPQGFNLFAIEGVNDDRGLLYKQQALGASPSGGSYSVHQSKLERFDRTTAEAYLAQMIRLVREEAHVFASYGHEIMLKQMSNLKRDLFEISQQIEVDQLEDQPGKTYLMIQPEAQANQVEYQYWLVPDPWDPRSLSIGTQLLQYKEILVQPGSCFFKTRVLPGSPKVHDSNKVKAMQNLMLTNERIVSKSDITQFIEHRLGPWLKSVEVRNGVAVSRNRKQGLVRTVDIVLHPSQNQSLSEKEWQHLLTGLSTQLKQRSVHGSTYRLRLATQP